MDWERAVDRNREALLRIVALLVAMTGLDESALAATLTRARKKTVLRILRPAESAVRRLIVLAAHGLVATVRKAATSARTTGRVARQTSARQTSPTPPSAQTASRETPGDTGLVVTIRPRGEPEPVDPRAKARKGHRQPARPSTAPAAPGLPLLDPLKRFSSHPFRLRPRSYPRVTVLGWSEPRPIPEHWIPSPDDLLDAASVCRRITALRRVLGDLPAQARRLARWRARTDHGEGPRRFSPMRAGRPPGHRVRALHRADDILRECHALARALERHDTS
ncbi:hypothetical protein [Oricola sp.]|uniref:hypothetical protein n=1 Tax=Oricola sp. TaxID=1979950 RepID=UPI0025D10C60|nr:hypothetical protein [Oricola sp.]MCI5074646.1 hypothetical protein [Oricola sp.]